jgi:hypothetical protein
LAPALSSRAQCVGWIVSPERTLRAPSDRDRVDATRFGVSGATRAWCYPRDVRLFLSTAFFAGMLASCDGGVGTDGGLDALDVDDAALDGLDPNVTVELGTGQLDWEDVPRTGARLELVYGAQGGYHVWGRVRFHGFAPDVDVNFSAVDLTTGRVLRTPTMWARRRIENGIGYALESVGNGTFATAAELVVLSIDCANEVVGHQLQVRVLVRERASQRIAADMRTAFVIDEVNPTACAMH